MTEPRLFVLWLDACDGSVPTHDGVVWPDGTTTLHHRHFGHTTTHHSVDAARQLTYGTQGRVEWPQPETTSGPVESPAGHARNAALALVTALHGGQEDAAWAIARDHGHDPATLTVLLARIVTKATDPNEWRNNALRIANGE